MYMGWQKGGAVIGAGEAALGSRPAGYGTAWDASDGRGSDRMHVRRSREVRCAGSYSKRQNNLPFVN